MVIVLLTVEMKYNIPLFVLSFYLSIFVSLFLTFFFSLSHFLSRSFSLFLSLCLSLTHSVSLSLILRLSLSLSLSLSPLSSSAHKTQKNKQQQKRAWGTSCPKPVGDNVCGPSHSVCYSGSLRIELEVPLEPKRSTPDVNEMSIADLKRKS